MITDKDANFVYFSRRLKTDFPDEFSRISVILDQHQVKYALLEGTKDIWCRDYMPVQVNRTKSVQFMYNPSYLKGYAHKKSNPFVVCKANGIKGSIVSAINLDGGNVVKAADKVLLTSRIFDENSSISKHKIISELEELFEVQVIIIPQINSDLTGHADGLVRFTDDNTLLINELEGEYAYYRRGLLKVIREHHLSYVELPWFKSRGDSAVGIYINFLEVGSLIVMPVFQTRQDQDKEAVRVMKRVYPDRTIETININPIGKQGGLLNCITWNISR